MNKSLAYIILFFQVWLFGHSQNQPAILELKKIRIAYLQAKQLSFDVEAFMYKDQYTKTPELISKGHAVRFEHKYMSHFLNYDLIVLDKNSTLMIDHSLKTMDYYVYDMPKDNTPKEFQMNFDSLALASDSIKMWPVNNGIRQFTFYDKDALIIQTEIYVDVKTNFIKRILYYYAPSNEDEEMEAHRVEVFYKNVSVAPVNQSVFKLDKYIIKAGQNHQFKPVEAYKGYLVNYYNSKS